jgi:hypothetical protein
MSTIRLTRMIGRVGCCLSLAVLTGACEPQKATDARRGSAPIETFVGRIDQNRYVRLTESGAVDLFSGSGIAERIERGLPIGGSDRTPYMLLRVPADRVEQARSQSDRTATFSLEAANNEVLLEVHYLSRRPTNVSANPEPQTLSFRPGDPWISGYYQVSLDKDSGKPVGLFSITRYRPPIGSNGTIGADFYETGILPDDTMPELRYKGDHTSAWPPLPESWH